MIEGGCLCGEIRYRVPGGVSNSMICHCASCRRAAAAPVIAWITVASSEFAIVHGRPVEFRSSPGVTRSFCGSCGCPLTYRHADRASEVDVTTCSLDAPERFPPTHHSWLVDDLAWVQFGDGLPGHQKNRANGDAV